MMRNIEDILYACGITGRHGDKRSFSGKIVFDSRKVSEGDLFVAVRGTLSDGHDFISAAIDKGAEYILCEKFPADLPEEVTFFRVKDSKAALAKAASNYYDNPSAQLKLVGITGTNGKTTIATLLYKTVESMGYKAGLLSTISVKYTGGERPATHTTPDPVQIQSSLKEMLEAGCEYVFMEVSSHAVDQKRIGGLEFDGGVFTNITRDHLDYHETFRNYLEAKKAFFDQLPAGAFALVNADDKNGKVMLQNTKASGYTYSLKKMADYRARIIESHLEGNLMNIDGKEAWMRLPGRFNAYNILAIYATGLLLGLPSEELLPALSTMTPVAGRFEVISIPEGPTAIVDYAHTPDALKNVLETIREIRKEGERIVCIVGAGGNRDKGKRPEMARIAAELSDKVVLTSDNPRFEEPASIIDDMKEGLDPVLIKKVVTITDRDEAIKATCAFAEASDIILLAGKGHETYQEIRGVRHHFDDREKLREYLKL